MEIAGDYDISHSAPISPTATEIVPRTSGKKLALVGKPEYPNVGSFTPCMSSPPNGHANDSKPEIRLCVDYSPFHKTKRPHSQTVPGKLSACCRELYAAA